MRSRKMRKDCSKISCPSCKQPLSGSTSRMKLMADRRSTISSTSSAQALSKEVTCCSSRQRCTTSLTSRPFERKRASRMRRSLYYRSTLASTSKHLISGYRLHQRTRPDPASSTSSRSQVAQRIGSTFMDGRCLKKHLILASSFSRTKLLQRTVIIATLVVTLSRVMIASA